MVHPETHAVTPTHGPRPAGAPDKCFYCLAPVGGVHDPSCVMRQRTVVLRYSFDVVVAVPEHWTEKDILFHRNESSWCASNAVEAITQRWVGDSETAPGITMYANGCPCQWFEAAIVREASEDDERGQPAVVAELLK